MWDESYELDKHLELQIALLFSVLVFQVLYFIALFNILLVLGPYAYFV